MCISLGLFCLKLDFYFDMSVFFFFQVKDYDFRDHLTTIAPTDQRELLLGNDANNWTYLYFPIFSATDLRIYKQCPLEVPTFSKRKKKVQLIQNWTYCKTVKICLYYINANEIPGELSRENLISSHVKITCYLHMWKYHRCYGYIINRAFHTKKLLKWDGLVVHWCLYNK